MGHYGPGYVAIAEGKTKVRPLGIFHGKSGRGLSVEMSVQNGPVTLLSVVETGRSRVKLVAAHAESVPGPILEIGNTNSRYRFPIGARNFVERWCAEGPLITVRSASVTSDRKSKNLGRFLGSSLNWFADNGISPPLLESRSFMRFLILLAGAAIVAHSQNLLLVNGKILTVDSKDSIAQAVAITNGKIVAVGSNDSVRAVAPPDAQVIDLHGKAATPDLVDTHCHFENVQELYGIALSDPSISRIGDILQRVQAAVAKSKPANGFVGAAGMKGNLRSAATFSHPIWTRLRRIIPSG